MHYLLFLFFLTNSETVTTRDESMKMEIYCNLTKLTERVHNVFTQSEK